MRCKGLSLWIKFLCVLLILFILNISAPPRTKILANNSISSEQSCYTSSATTAPSYGGTTAGNSAQPLQVGEIVSLRSSTARHYYNGNGKFTAEISAGPIHYQDDQGQWLAIDNTLITSDIADFKYRNAGNEFKAYFADNTSAAQLLKVQIKQATISLIPFNAVPVIGNVNGSVIEYRGAIAEGTADLRYAVRNEGIKEDIILNSYKSNSFTFKLNLEGLRPEIAQNGNLLLYNNSYEIVAYAQKPYAMDASGKITHKANFSLAMEGTDYLLTITIDQSWLQAPDRTYPVTIDPWWRFIRGASKDAFISSYYAEQNYEGWDLKVGYDDTYPDGFQILRSLVQFDLSSIPAEQRIIAGQFSMKIHTTNGSTNIPADVYRITRNWDKASVCWNKADSTTQWSTPGGDYDASPPDPGPPASFNNTQYPNKAAWWITDIVREWYADTSKNYGLIVKAADEDILLYRNSP